MTTTHSTIDQIPPGVEFRAADDTTQVAAEVGEHFAGLHHRVPSAVYAAPGRVNLVGEHTDYNSGLCLPIALPYATYAAVAPREDDVLTLTSFQESGRFRATLGSIGPGRVSGWASYAAGVIWAAREDGLDVPGMDIVVHGTVPLGAGLSSSASLECSIAIAVAELSGLEDDEATRRRLIEICGRAEREVAGAPTGGLDQTASLLAESGHALLLDCQDWSLTQLPWDPAAHGLELLVVDTRAAHALSDGSYGQRRDQCHHAAEALGATSLRAVSLDDLRELAHLHHLRPSSGVLAARARHVVTEIQRVRAATELLRHDDYPALGAIFSASHASLRDDFEVSCPELDTVCEVATTAGALGARMTGGGFGGSAIVLTPVDKVPGVMTRITQAFQRRGWTAPLFLSGSAAPGARRVHPPPAHAPTAPQEAR